MKLVIRFSAFIRYWRKWEFMGQLFIDFKKPYESASREVFNNILLTVGGTHEISQAD
jgi:hypothetical protein